MKFLSCLRIKLKRDLVQKNIQKIYESFLNIAGRDYSKTEILINQYTKSCENSLADPEARMVYWDIQFQKKGDKTSEETANSLLGVKLGDRTLNYKTSGKKGYYDSEIIFDRYIYTKNTNKFFDNRWTDIGLGQGVPAVMTSSKNPKYHQSKISTLL